MKRTASLLSAIVLAAGVTSMRAQQPKTSSAEQTGVEDTARAFVQAYDDGNAEAIAGLWSDDGEYIEGQTIVKGRSAIQQLYEAFFRAHPGSKMNIKIDSIRMLAPTVALEQGTASVANSPNGPPSASAYTAVHVKQDGKWQMASVRDSALPTPPADEELQDLAWLVGDWAARGDAAKVEVRYGWIANKAFLQGETMVHANGNADAIHGGVQIIGKDPISGRIVSWFFNADGGHGFGEWFKDGSRWMIDCAGVSADGATTSATNVLYHADDNVLSWQSVNRVRGDARLPDTKETVIERVPASK